MTTVDYTDPEVLGPGVIAGWADRETDPTRIHNWPDRQAAAAIWFPVIDGHPVNPHGPTRIQRGRNRFGHWGEAKTADAFVTAEFDGHRWLAMIRRPGGAWALPGGFLDPGETPAQAAPREFAEETGFHLEGTDLDVLAWRYVPDERGSGESWAVTAPVRVNLGPVHALPHLEGADDAMDAAWIRADTYEVLVDYLARVHAGQVYGAHEAMLADLLAETGNEKGSR